MFLLPAERSVLQPRSVFQSAETVDRVAVQPAAAIAAVRVAFWTLLQIMLTGERAKQPACWVCSQTLRACH